MDDTTQIFKNLVAERKVEQLVELLKTITFERQVLEEAFCLSSKNGICAKFLLCVDSMCFHLFTVYLITVIL